MSRPALARALEHIRATAGRPTPISDDILLSRFAADRDEAAFAELVRRHGPLVRGVTRRRLADAHEADDVAQATFLNLARQAGRVGGRPLAPWLFTVAHRLACKAQVRAARRPGPPHDDIAVNADPLDALTARELVAALDDELARLPDRYRLPLVLCALKGLSRDEAAAQLGWTLGSLRGRLERGRELLRKRLTARGLTVPAVLAGELVAAPAEAMPAALVRAVVRAAVAAPATQGILRMTMALLSVGGLCIGAGAALWSGVPGRHGPATPPAAAIPPPPQQQAVGVVDPDNPKFAGHFSGRVMGPDGKPLSGARVFIAPKSKEVKEIGPVRATTDADGRFEFDAPDMTYAELDGLPARREGLLIVTKDGYAPDWFETWGKNHSSLVGSNLVEYWDPVKGAPLDLQLAKDGVPIHGRFLDPDGRPLAGANVRLTRLMIPRARDLSAHLDRWSKASVISGFLTKVPDYQGELYQPNLVPGLTTETRTDADGRFTLSGLGRDRLAWLSVSARDVVDTGLEVMTRDAADVGTFLDHNGKPTGLIHGAGFTLKLKRGLTIYGLVRDRASGAPIPGMWAATYWNPLTDPTLTQGVTVSDENGRFAIGGLDPESTPPTITALPRPGGQYLMAQGTVKHGEGVLIECSRGIPFRLKLVDEQGKPVEGNVGYWPIGPNPQIEELIKPLQTSNWPIMDRAARRADGTYEGFVLPGPGAVVVEMPNRRSYRPAHVDPKAFFEPGRTKWPEQSSTFYGTQNTLQSVSGSLAVSVSLDQFIYAAIVLVNPAKGSALLELSATVVRDRPRQVSLVDADGKPVIGAEMRYENGYAYQLRAASFPLTELDPARIERLMFIKKDRRLIGILKARGDVETPYTVRMQAWGTVTGRFVDQNGKPLKMSLAFGDGPDVTNADPEGSKYMDAKLEEDGHFRIDGLVPGQRYSCVRIYRQSGSLTGAVFENLALRPGEVQDVGDVRVKPLETSRVK